MAWEEHHRKIKAKLKAYPLWVFGANIRKGLSSLQLPSHRSIFSVHAMVSVASVSQIYYSTFDIQHKMKAAARAHTIFRRGAEFRSDLRTSKEPAGPKRYS